MQIRSGHNQQWAGLIMLMIMLGADRRSGGVGVIVSKSSLTFPTTSGPGSDTSS